MEREEDSGGDIHLSGMPTEVAVDSGGPPLGRASDDMELLAPGRRDVTGARSLVTPDDLPEGFVPV